MTTREKLAREPRYTAKDMREAFIAGTIWSDINPIDINSYLDVPASRESEALRRWPDKEEK